ncbi:MAG: ATP-binding protein [Lentimicrobiaceae bacterium]|jgi:two-component system sensor histidine kinase KdpD
MNTTVNSISGTINPIEKILILVGAETTASDLFLKARQYSSGINTEWFAVCVDPGVRASHAYRAQFNDNLTVALHSGAKVIHLLDSDKISGIVKLVSQNKIDRILIGNLRLGKFSSSGNAGYFKNQLAKHLPGVEINEIQIKEHKLNSKGSKLKITTKPVEYLYALLAVLLTGALCFLVKYAIGYQTVGLIFLMLTAVLSLKLGRGAVIFTALLNFVVWNFFFIPPILTFHIASFHDTVVLFANLAVAITGGSLISRLRRNQADLELSRERITLLYSLLESLNNADSIKEVVHKVRAELKRHFDADAVIYLKGKRDQTLEKHPFGNQDLFSEEEFENAVLAFEHKGPGQIIKLNEKKLLQYFPLSGQRGTLGVIGVVTENNYPVDDEKLIFLKSFVTQIASALEREISVEKSKEDQVYEESQKLFQTVLNSVSHELRTPVSIISSAVSNLQDERTASDPESRRKICLELDSTSKRLNLLVENILDMSKVDSGSIKLNLQSCDVSDLIGVVLNPIKDQLKDHKVNIEIPENLPLLNLDINWMKQALLNIIYNAINYTPENSQILLSVTLLTESALITISDNGPGVPESSIAQLFDKFYRVPGSKSGGTGLGLTISKAIIEAHNGSVKAKNLSSGGLSILIQLPILN